MSEKTTNELAIMFEDFNKRTDEKFAEQVKKSDERHNDYKEERKETKAMLQDINNTLKIIKEQHSETEKSIASLLQWSIEAKKVIESNSVSISQLQKRDFLVMGGVAVIMTIGVSFATYFIRDIVQTEIEKNNKRLEQITQNSVINGLDKKASSVIYEN